MTTREKIIVGLMVLVVGYGVYTIFLEKPPGIKTLQAQTGLEALNTFITKVAETTKSGLSDADAYIIQQAEAQWDQDPMVSVETEIEPEVKEKGEDVKTPPAQAVRIVYSGYLEMGDKRIAIINGLEYEPGDVLVEGGYMVREISSTRVVLATTQGGKKTLVVPLVEAE